MKIDNLPFGLTEWDQVEETVHPGDQGEARWRTVTFNDIRVRMVDYSPGYVADHWCQKGHVIYCLEGDSTVELETGEIYKLSAGMSYIVSDNLSSHRSVTENGVKLLIVDGDFLKHDLGI